MPSPFPGMDPYLEGYLWPDVQQALAAQLRKQLAPLIEPKYAARLGVYMIGDEVPSGELGIVFPDVEVVSTPTASAPAERRPGAAVIAPAPVTAPIAYPIQARMTRVEVHDAAHNQLVTAIELLSPANKRQPGLNAYLEKRRELIAAGVHLMEIDLIRRGTRPSPPEEMPDSPYCAILIRARHLQAEIWPMGLREPLPVLPVPLRLPDPDVPLDMQTALATIYDEARYYLTLDYTQPPPPPPLAASDQAWASQLIRERSPR